MFLMMNKMDSDNIDRVLIIYFDLLHLYEID